MRSAGEEAIFDITEYNLLKEAFNKDPGFGGGMEAKSYV